MAKVSNETATMQAVTLEQWQAASKAERAGLFPLSQQSDEATNQLCQRCVQFAKDNPSLALTLVYLAMSLMGLLFQTALLYRFGLNVLPYLEITDFLLSALTHPKVVVVLIFMLLIVAAFFSFERRFRRSNFKYAVSTESSFQRWWVPQPALWMSLLFLTYLIMAAWSNGNSFAKDIRAGKGNKLEIFLVYPMPLKEQKQQKVQTLHHASLISRTASYLFVYHEDKVKVLPHANIAALLPELDQEVAAGKAKPDTAQQTTEKVTNAQVGVNKEKSTTNSSDKAGTKATDHNAAATSAEGITAPAASPPQKNE